MKRREFLLTALGSGLALVTDGGEVRAETPPAGFRPNVFVHLAPNGLVSIVCSRSEMGQGVRSSIPPLIAAELGADMAHVTIVQGDGDKAYGDQNTDGSRSIRMDFDKLRMVGAAARMMLTTVAARRFGVPESALSVHDHAVHHPKLGSVGFGDLALEAAKLPVPRQIVLRPRSELKMLGKDLPLLDGPAIVTGKATFGADVKLPGMLTAVIARPPVVGGKVARHDATKALAIPGVKKVVVLPAPKRPFAFQPLGGVAVVATHTWAAMRGRAALDVTWDHGENAGYDSASYREALERSVAAPGKVMRSVGDVDAAMKTVARKVTASYYLPHLAHAPMEPPVAVAKVESGTCEVWTSTQNPQAAQKELAGALGIDESKITVHVTLLGGGFGRKSKPDYVVEAALLSKEMGAPVRVQWAREDDLQHDYFHSVSLQSVEAGLDGKGDVVAWQHRTAFPPIASTFSDATFSSEGGELSHGLLDAPLAVPNVRVENCEARAHVRIGWLRSVGNIYHAFAVQSFIDELAHARGKDPRENLLEIIGPPRVLDAKALGVGKVANYGQPLDLHPVDTARHRRVVERVTELCGWSARGNRAMGLAAHRSFVSYIAVVIAVSPGRIDEAWIVADVGTVVNRERVRSQLEGAVVFGLSHAMYGAVTMKGGAVEQSNFRDFRLMRLHEAPRAIHVDILESEGPPGGVGEPGVPPVAPALANAIFALTKKRVRELPVRSF